MRFTMLALAALVLALGSAAGDARAQARFDFDHTPGRLSKAVVPSRYALSFELDPQRQSFDAEAVISLTLRSRQPHIALHAHELTLRQATLQGEDGKNTVLRIRRDPRRQMWQLRAARPLAAGAYTLSIRYAGKAHDTDEGLYRTSGAQSPSQPPMLATQLQAVAARTLFPAFDEPAFRAVFDIRIRAPSGLQVLSNMPEQSAQAQGATTLHRFAPTPSMPSYLVALAVGRFDTLEGEAAGVPLRIFTAPGKRELARYALGVTQQVLPFYNQYFGLPYALPKLDLLAVPSVRNGAMEDWGLISFIEDALLFDPERSSPHTQSGIFDILAHEVAHQWFGNLVTASSWDEIWLNEAFATWLAEKTADHFNPGWQVPLSRRLMLEEALARDAGSATRAIRSGRVDEAQVSDVFDSITYTKGGAVLAMLEQWLGPDTFQRGLAAYMEGQKFSNATAGDLWHYLSAASGHDVSGVARSWTDQVGYPLVEVQSRCENGNTLLTLRQQRFTVGASASASRTPATWLTPVSVARGAVKRTLLLDAPERSFELEGCTDAPLVANAQGSGFYRVRYTEEAQRALLQRFAELAPADKVTLASDIFALARAGQLPMASWLDLLAVLPKVQDDSRGTLITQAAEALDWMSRANAGSPVQANVQRVGRLLLSSELERLGWEPRAGESSAELRLRPRLIKHLARFDDADVLQRAGELYDRDSSGSQALPGSTREAVTYAAGRGADAARFATMRARLLATTSEEERWSLAAALAAGRDATRARALLALSTTRQLPPNVATELPGLVARHSDFGELAYSHVRVHWSALAALAGNGNFGERAWLLPSAAGGFSQRSDAERLLADQRRLAGAGASMQAAEVAETIKLRAAVRERTEGRFSEDTPVRDSQRRSSPP